MAINNCCLLISKRFMVIPAFFISLKDANLTKTDTTLYWCITIPPAFYAFESQLPFLDANRQLLAI